MHTIQHMLESPLPKVVIYHERCYDGFAGAFVAWNFLGDKATYLPHSTNRNLVSGLPSGRCAIFMIDICFDRSIMEAMAQDHDLVVLDHHQTSVEALAGLDVGTIDLMRCGAMQTLDYFSTHGDLVIPACLRELITRVQDRDLWTWSQPDSRAYMAGLESYPMTFGDWSLTAPRTEVLINEGRCILRARQREVERIVTNAFPITLDGHCGIVVNTPCFQNELGEHLLEKYPTAKFAGMFCENHRDQTIWALRSRPTDDFDVSVLAKNHGGGGHTHAAGFRVEPGVGE